jgi:hypothetical protein
MKQFLTMISECCTVELVYRRHDIQHNDTHHNDKQHNGTEHNDTQHNDIQYNDTKHNGLVCDTQHNIIMLSIFMLGVVFNLLFC